VYPITISATTAGELAQVAKQLIEPPRKPPAKAKNIK